MARGAGNLQLTQIKSTGSRFLISLSEISFQHSLDLEYDNHPDYCVCNLSDSNPYCSCGTIDQVDILIDSQDTLASSLTDAWIWNSLSRKKAIAASKHPTYRARIEKVFKEAKLDKDSFEVCIKDGYYGQEIDWVRIKQPIAQDIEKKLSRLHLPR